MQFVFLHACVHVWSTGRTWTSPGPALTITALLSVYACGLTLTQMLSLFLHSQWLCTRSNLDSNPILCPLHISSSRLPSQLCWDPISDFKPFSLWPTGLWILLTRHLCIFCCGHSPPLFSAQRLEGVSPQVGLLFLYTALETPRVDRWVGIATCIDGRLLSNQCGGWITAVFSSTSLTLS